MPIFEDVRHAAARVAPHVHRTPVLTCATLDARTGARLYFKCENFQKVGAFKYRGATNAVQSIPEDILARGVATHSSGNHAAALALAASVRGCPAVVVMPETAPRIKRAAVAGYGARIVTCAPTLAAREETLVQVLAETGAVEVHPYDDPQVVAGQGTAALELLTAVPDLEVLIAPVGGGGLLGGTLLAARGAGRPGLRVYGAEPAAADDARRSLAAGYILPSVDPKTVCDGLLTSLGEIPFAVFVREGIDGIVTASERGILEALRLVLERMKVVVEPSAVVPLAVLLEGAIDLRGRRVGILLSGGNLSVERLGALLAEPLSP